MTFFTDANISHKLARMLDIFDTKNEIRSHDDRFPQGTADEVWLAELANDDPKPVVICGDGRILRNPAQKQVLADCDLMFVYLTKGWTNADWHTQAWKMVKVWPDIVRNVAKTRRPTLFEVSLNSLKVEQRATISELGRH